MATAEEDNKRNLPSWKQIKIWISFALISHYWLYVLYISQSSEPEFTFKTEMDMDINKNFCNGNGSRLFEEMILEYTTCSSTDPAGVLYSRLIQRYKWYKSGARSSILYSCWIISWIAFTAMFHRKFIEILNNFRNRGLKSWAFLRMSTWVAHASAGALFTWKFYIYSSGILEIVMVAGLAVLTANVGWEWATDPDDPEENEEQDAWHGVHQWLADWDNPLMDLPAINVPDVNLGDGHGHWNFPHMDVDLLEYKGEMKSRSL